MSPLLVLFALLAGPGVVGGPADVADSVPLPPPRPAASVAQPALAGLPEDPFAGLDRAEISSAPTSCDQRLAAMAEVTLLPRLIGPGACGGHDLVRVDAILLADRTRVAVKPQPMLNCPMAESLAAWVRDAVAPALAKQDMRLRSIQNYDSYECRSRNRIPGAKVSEHAHGDAIDVRSLTLDDGRRLMLTDPAVDKDLRNALRDSACHRFPTVLGPGEAYHSGHIHLDALIRRAGYRICHWDVLEPVPIPLPRPRPVEVASAAPATPEPAKSDPADRAAASAGMEASTTDAAWRQEDQAASENKDPANRAGAPARTRAANAVIAMAPAAAGRAASDPADAERAKPKLLHVEPRRGAAAPQPDAVADPDRGVNVPLPEPKPASLAEASPAPKVHRARHRPHRWRRAQFPFPFIPWR